MVDVSCSSLIQLLSCIEKANRKNTLQINASLDKNKSQRMQV